MGIIRPLRSRYKTAIVLGIGAALAAHVPPFDFGQRIDGKLYDLWARASASPAAARVVLVTFDDAEWLRTLTDVAEEQRARLLVTTLPQPPSAHINKLALGPTHIALGSQVLRNTEWQRGGHLWFKPDLDGVVRAELPLLEDVSAIPSLALSAFRELADQDSAMRNGTAAGSAMPSEGFDRGTSSERRIRFFARDGFVRLNPNTLLASSERLTDAIVVAGRNFPQRRTPLGPMADHELISHVLAGYQAGAVIQTSVGAGILAWGLPLAALFVLALRPRWIVRLGWGLPVGGSTALLGLSAGGMYFASVWIPVAAPTILIATAGAIIAAHPKRRFRTRRREPTPDLARDLFGKGKLADAWALYREIPPTRDLLMEMYDLARSLEHAGYAELAADAFHRITLVDAHFRDAARRLVSTSHARSHAGTVSLQLRGELPDHLGRYELLEPIGQGSAGKVFLGRDPKINRLVAIKVIDLLAEYEPEELEDGKDQFRREAETAGRLSHPDIVTVFDIGETDGLAYIAMEYLKGRHLSDFVHPESMLPVPMVLELGARVANALDYAHTQNVVHRDIKPANIMYDSVSDSIKITDFGIARLIDVSRTRTGIVLGTPSYMAPEQLEGRNVNGHTDLFALGVTIYELLTGRLPFRGASMTQLMFVIANERHQPITVTRSELPKPLDALLDTALAKDPAERFQTGAEMADALRVIAGQMG